MTVAAIGEASVVRLNPQYAMRDGTRWSASWPTPLSEYVDADDGLAVLVPTRDSGLPTKWVSPAAAEALTSMLDEGELAQRLDSVTASALVLDSVLEVSTPDGWRHGAAAYDALWDDEPVVALDRLGRMSVAAVAWAATLPIDGAEGMVGRLYCFARFPMSHRWRRRFPGADSVLASLGGPANLGDWMVATDPAGPRPWLSFARRTAAAGADDFPYKLYVSPHPDQLREGLPAIARALVSTPATRFKVGADAAGLLRPDKLVVYLRDHDEMEETSASLAQALHGLRPHGVPFSADVAGEGLLSWGGDPPSRDAPVGEVGESWRLSVCRRLAEALLAGRRTAYARSSAAGYALTRLALDGVALPGFAPTSMRAPIPRGQP